MKCFEHSAYIINVYTTRNGIMKLLFLLTITLLTTATVVANQLSRCVRNDYAALTFDDGPHNNTNLYLDVLEKYNVSGAFFVSGLSVYRNNKYDFIKNMHERGHVIASHGFSHAAMEKLNDFNKERELYDNELIFRQTFNKRPQMYRPPYFSYDANVVNIANKFGYTIVTTELNTDDWMEDNTPAGADAIFSNYLEKFNNVTGHIILQHDYHGTGYMATEKIINHLLQNNYTIVSLMECLGLTGDGLQTDNTYGPLLESGVNN